MQKHELEEFGKRIFAFSGSGGFGKDSVVKGAAEHSSGKVVLVPRTTTRLPREGEVNGQHYFFVPRQDFEQMMQAGSFIPLEDYKQYGIAWNPRAFDTASEDDQLIAIEEHAGQYYGITARPLTTVLKQPSSSVVVSAGADCIGLKRVIPTATIIYIRATVEEAERRLKARGDTPKDVIHQKVVEARKKLGWEPDFYDHIVDNNDGQLDEAIGKVVQIMGLDK